VVSPIYAFNPVITLILAHLFLKRLEALDFLLAAGTMISVVGVILVILGATG
jgi:drug/metabolite transporter (DMT)-like permease